MAKQTINLGSSANDGTGDPLRTAFDKVNDNFDELYLYSTVTSTNNITITGNTIASDNTNGDVIIDPNGTGRLVMATGSEIRFTDHTDNAIAFVDADGDLTLSGNLTYDGSSALAVTGSVTATTTITATGDVTGSTLLATGDTAAGDDAAIGYTAAEGLILTGQGSTNDVTIKNDADADVLEIPTGTTTVTTTGRLQPTTFSTGVVVLTATGAITAAAHAGKTLSMAEVGGNALCTFTLPAATGTGDVYRFVVGVVNTSNYVIKVPDASHTIKGQVLVQDDSTEGGAAGVIGWKADGTDDTITINGTTTGGVSIGDYVEITDLIANQYVVSGMLQASGTEASPFSATVS